MRRITEPWASPLTRYGPVDADLSAARTLAAPHGAMLGQPLPWGLLGPLASILAAWAGLGAPVGGLVHTRRLGAHRDQRSPSGVRNVTLFLRDEATTGGELVFPDEAIELEAADGWAVTFDGRARLHEVRPWAGGTRASVTLWCPARLD